MMDTGHSFPASTPPGPALLSHAAQAGDGTTLQAMPQGWQGAGPACS